MKSLPLLALLALAACAPTYSLVPAAPVRVAKSSFRVAPGAAWNRAPATPLDVPGEENWTQNGLALDRLTFIGGLRDGQAIARQRKKDDRQVPVFRAGMTPPDLVSMIESYHRIRGGATLFATGAVAPATFLGHPGLRVDYSFVGADEVKRRGSSVIAVDGGKLYMMTLDAPELHYFPAALPQFDAMAGGATAG